MRIKYPLFKVHVKPDEALERIKEVLYSGYLNEGVQVTQLTDAFRVRMKTTNLVLTNSCTSAITMALKLAGVRYLDEVISTPMTCVATNTPIINQFANIVWADIDTNTGCISVEHVAELLNKNPHTKAVVAVAWAGIPPDLEPLYELCKKYNVSLILDAAHAMGATYKNKNIHEFADFTCYSLQAIKHITSGDGGILVTKNDEKYLMSKSMKWFGIDRDLAKDSNGNWKGQHWDFDVEEAGFKFNMNNISAALGLSQMPYIDGILEGHRLNAATYTRAFKKSKFVKPLTTSYKHLGSYWVYTVLLDTDVVNRDWLLTKLNDESINAGLVHIPNQGYSCFNKFYKTLPNVTKFSTTQLSLPVGWWLDEDDIKHIHNRVEALCEIYVKENE